MPNATPLMTVDEFLKLPSSECLRELVKGRAIEYKLPSPRHGRACAKLFMLLGNAFEAQQKYLVSARCGIVTHSSPDTVRGPAMAIFDREKFLPALEQATFTDIPPSAVIEVLDKSDSWLDIMEKGLEYLHFGTTVVMLVDPFHASVVILRDHKPPQRLHATDVFQLPDLLGDFRVAVSEFFA
jgi:Uma2 family endonuclease